jgi:hypothetical protein
VRYADDGGTQGLEFVRRLGELVGFHRAARCECRGIKVQHHRAALQRIGQGKLEWLAGEGRLGGEIRRLRTGLQCRVQGGGQTQAAQGKNDKTLHGDDPFSWS